MLNDIADRSRDSTRTGPPRAFGPTDGALGEKRRIELAIGRLMLRVARIAHRSSQTPADLEFASRLFDALYSAWTVAYESLRPPHQGRR
jgi:hypothetical protein